MNYRYQERLRILTIDSALYRDGAIAKGDLDASANELNYLKGLKSLSKERLSTDEEYRELQLRRIDKSIELMERNLEAITRNLENLTITALIDGQISQFSHEIGESKTKGVSLGRIDVIDSFTVSAPVDQYYLNRVNFGQEATAEINEKTYELSVSKIFPAIENGQFEIHLKFLGEQMENPRRGQNVRIRLKLSATKKALKVPKGGFYGSTGGRYAYVINKEGIAEKRTISLGAQNPEYFEVISGLDENEEVIISSYESFGDSETLNIIDKSL